MDKVFFRDNEQMPIMETLVAMINLTSNFKDSNQIIDKEDVEKIRKIFINSYTTLENVTEPMLVLDVAEKCSNIGIEFDIEKLKLTCVFHGIVEAKITGSITPHQQQMVQSSKEFILNSFVYGHLYKYFEEHLKKIIIRELFNTIFLLSNKLEFVVKVSSEKLDEIFKNNTIKNRESFFCQQLQTWATYNQIIPFMKYEIKKRDDEKEKKDIFINVSILKSMLKNKFS